MRNKKNQKVLKVPVYRQTLSTTCGAACLLMIGNFFNPQKFPLNKEKELEIHKKIKYWQGDEYGEFANVAKMIRFARENGFKVRYFLEVSSKMFIPSQNLEEKIWKRYIDSFFEVLEQEKKKGLEVIKDCKIETLINEVIAGKPVICEINWKEFITHFVVIRGIKGNMIYFIDPASKNGYKKEHKEKFKRMMNLEYGKSFFSLAQ